MSAVVNQELQDSAKAEEDSKAQRTVIKASSALETSRSLHSEHEALLCFASSMLSNPGGLPSSPSAGVAVASTDTEATSNFIPGGVLDAWLALTENTAPKSDSTLNQAMSNSKLSLLEDSLSEYAIPAGQYARAASNLALTSSIQDTSQIAKKLLAVEKEDANECFDALYAVIESNGKSGSASLVSNNQESQDTTPDWFLRTFYERVKEIRDYHARHEAKSNNTLNLPRSLPNISDSLPPNNMKDNQGNPSWFNEPETTSLLRPTKRLRSGNPSADGYDLHSLVTSQLQPIQSGQQFSVEETMGIYLDLQSFHEQILSCSSLQSVFASRKTKEDTETVLTNQETKKMTYSDFCAILATGLSTTLDEKAKLLNRKKYMRWMQLVCTYLSNFLARKSPLIDVEVEVVKKAVLKFEREWSVRGGIEGWECKNVECALAFTSIPIEYWEYDPTLKRDLSSEYEKLRGVNSDGIKLKNYATVEELMAEKTDDELKVELSRLNMKCGGKPLDRAKRLWQSRDTPLDQLPLKLFIKTNNKPKPVHNGQTTSQHQKETNQIAQKDTNEGESIYQITSYQRRIDIARMEVILTAHLDQLRPTLDSTLRRADRRLTQTRNEREREVEEELFGSGNENSLTGDTKEVSDKENEDEESSDEEDAPIYNPKGVPLNWDGKPIPYWLFKLHGLNHFFSCEICGNESYRGRRNFEKHFTESKHSYGMRCLGIPNTKHFHGVTKIEDAKILWEKLQVNVNKDLFDASKEEEYEDSQGNVLTRTTYEDLARQGLL